jgi:beta-aspartyl-peptidase (threonine type)
MMWAIIVHGGAKTIEAAQASANRAGCEAALQAGVLVLERGGSSIDAAEAAVRALEDNPTFNAGKGSAKNSDGSVETCAAIMEGRCFNIGAIAAAKSIANPISAARRLLFEKSVLLAGDGATAFAQQVGIAVTAPQQGEKLQRSVPCGGEKRHDTVGCIALDRAGLIAAAVSTGGLEGTPPGRVGDSALPGCGFYCDNSIGGVVLSGDGEEIARMMLAARIMQKLEGGTARSAVEAALVQMDSVGGEAGAIVLTSDGYCEWAHNSDHFAVAYATSSSPEPKIFLNQNERRHV